MQIRCAESSAITREMLLFEDSLLHRTICERKTQPLQVGMPGAKLILDIRDLAEAAFHSSESPRLELIVSDHLRTPSIPVAAPAL
jgi:hypothetical protein